MTTSRKKSKLRLTSTVDTKIIVKRTLEIIGSGEFDLQNLFSHDYAPIPTSLFKNISETKLKTLIQVKESSRNKLQKPD